MPPPPGSKARDAGTGQYVPLRRAVTHPTRTVVESPPRKPPTSKPKR